MGACSSLVVHPSLTFRSPSQGRPDMPREDAVALYSSLINLGLKCYPGRIDYVDTAIGSVVEFFTGERGGSSVDAEEGAEKQAIRGAGMYVACSGTEISAPVFNCAN